jgi:hypothetical protein
MEPRLEGRRPDSAEHPGGVVAGILDDAVDIGFPDTQRSTSECAPGEPSAIWLSFPSTVPLPFVEMFVAGACSGVTLSSSLHPLSASGPVVQIWPAGRVP